jgi:hypothetical protein
MNKIAQYRKLAVASVGFALLLVSNIAGVEVGPEDSDAAVSIIDGVIALCTTFGVFRVPNEPRNRGR